jgi:hypothetical protein
MKSWPLLIPFAFLASACQSSSPPPTQSTPPTAAAPVDPGVPAARNADETYDHASARARARPQGNRPWILESETPEAMSRELGQLDLSALPAWSGAEALHQGFGQIHRDRFLEDPRREGSSPRAIPWMYPDDGCFARAEAAVERLAHQGLPEPKKLFVFGSLSIETPHAAGGRAYWWYHVAPAVRVGGDAYVLDPAVNPSGALKVAEWIALMTDATNEAADESPSDPPRLAVCDASAYDAYAACAGASRDYARQEAQHDMPGFLQSEWDRLIELGRDPRAELGE